MLENLKSKELYETLIPIDGVKAFPKIEMLSQKQPLDNPIPGSKLIPILDTFTILTFFMCEKV